MLACDLLFRKPPRLADLGNVILLTLVSAALCTSVGRAERPEHYIEGLTLFEFAVVEGAESEPYLEKMLKVSMSMLEEHLGRHVDELSVVGKGPGLAPEEKAEIARETGRYFVDGEFETFRENIEVRARWRDLKENASGSTQVFLGRSSLKDFDLVNEKIAELAGVLVRQMIQSSEGQGSNKLAKRVLVSCFTGGEAVNLGFLDRFLTLELPQSLQESLESAGVSPEVIRIEALSFDQYGEECLGYGVNRQYDSWVVEDRGPRYTISGTILPSGDGFHVRVLLQDKSRRGLVPIADYEANRDVAVLMHPTLIAQKLAKALVVYFVQQALKESDIFTGSVDGKPGPATQSAVRRFQEVNEMEATGEIDSAVLEALDLK